MSNFKCATCNKPKYHHAWRDEGSGACRQYNATPEEVASLRTSLAAAERERDSAKAKVERLRELLADCVPELKYAEHEHIYVDESERGARRAASLIARIAALTPAPPQAKENNDVL